MAPRTLARPSLLGGHASFQRSPAFSITVTAVASSRQRQQQCIQCKITTADAASANISPQDGDPPPEDRVSQYIRQSERTITPPSIRSTGTLRPGAEWYPSWMRYRRREDNYVLWKDKFLRCSVDIPEAEKRWTIFSTLWWLVMEFKYFGIPPAFRYIFYVGWRAVLHQVYQAHKRFVLWQCKLDAALSERNGSAPTFSKGMALRRVHWKNTLLAELLYYINICKTGRVFMLPPEKRSVPRPSFFFLF